MKPPSQEWRKDYMKRLDLRNKINSLMAEEKALAVVVPSREMRDNGGTGGTFSTTAAPT